jgi:hypothetical protein
MGPSSISRPVLRDLPLDARLVVAAFLISVGIGYCSALAQLHFQAAGPGQLLPDAKKSGEIYHGRRAMSQLERLLVSDEGQPFNGSGSMRTAFTTRSAGWANAIQKRARQLKLDPKRKPDLLHAEKELRTEREGEILVLLDWLHNGLKPEPYTEDAYPLPAALASHPLTPTFVSEDEGVKKVQIKSLIETRCARCHGEGKGGPAGQAPLDSYEEIQSYCAVETAGGGMSLTKLAQTTHVHLLGFAMLYGLTGLIFCFTSYPAVIRFVLAPLPLVAQVVEIAAGWWGGRAYEPLALAIPVFGGIIAVGLVLQIILSLFNLFGRSGKVVVFLLLIAGALGTGALTRYVIHPYLQEESRGASLQSPEP